MGHPHPHPRWTDEQVALAREYASSGMTAREIGARLGGFTKCTVIARCIKLGIKLHGTKLGRPPKQEKQGRRETPERESRHVPPPAAAPRLTRPKFRQHVPPRCMWAGCARLVPRGQPYCEEHRLVYREKKAS